MKSLGHSPPVASVFFLSTQVFTTTMVVERSQVLYGRKEGLSNPNQVSEAGLLTELLLTDNIPGAQ